LVAELINAGVHSYLHKPFNVSVLPTFCKELSEVTSPEDAIELEQDDQVLEEFTLLKKSEESFRALVNASGDIIFRINPQGILNFASPAVEEQLGYTRDDLEEERINIAKFVHSEDLIRVMAGIRQVIQGTSIQGLECRLMYQDRVHFRWYSINCYPLYNSQKNFIGVGGIARDITSIKQFERDIRQRNERLAALNEIARIVSQSLNLDNILNNVIDKVLEIMGFQAGSIFLSNPKTKQFVLKSCRVNTETVADKSDILNMSNIYEVLPEGVFETDVPHVVGDIFQHPKLSKTFLVEMGFRTMVTIPLKSKEMPLGMMMLLTQEQRKVNREDHELLMSIANQVGMTIENINFYQQELNARMRLEELNKLKDDFVAIVSHDLRSPLTAILGASEILLNEELMDPPLSEEQRSLVNDIQSMGTQQLHLVNDLLDLAKIESGKLELNPTMADIQTVARQCYDTMKVLANNKSIKMNFVVEPYLPKTKIDVPKIVQVINNLVGNAIKFTEIGGEVTLHLDLEDHKFLKVSVTDTGQGIEPEHLRWLFSKFTKVQRQGTGGERGTGLGLSICKNLIDLHHGEIWAESRVGVGSTFAFTLPVPERVILIIDDSLTVVKAVKDMLLKHLVHVTVKYALNGHDGLKVIEETSPVVLILDYMMPDMDGIMVFRELKNRYGTRIPPTIFLTASRDLEVRRQIFELGADDYLHKPVDVNDLLPRISRFL
jgi:PAS domain S-box-containing protein